LLVLLITALVVLQGYLIAPSGFYVAATTLGSATSTLLEDSSGPWAIVGAEDQIPQINNLFWLFGNQSIPYVVLHHSQIVDYDRIRQYAGLITWTNVEVQYNFSAVKLFARTKPVIAHVFDFCYNLYPALRGSIRTISTYVAAYMVDWGNFRVGDRVEMHNGTHYLDTISASDLSIFSDLTVIAKAGTGQVALFNKHGDNPDSGFYVMDLYVTRPNSYEAGNYHLFPAIAKAATIKAGRYSRWMTNSLEWQTLDWIYSWMSNFNNTYKDIVKLQKIGTSVQERQINALFIGKGTRYLIADAAIHGNEKGGTHGILRFAELLVEWYQSNLDWRDRLTQYTIIVIPVLNPDGYVANTHENAHGIDLNRQFPPAETTAEPEAWALRMLMENYPPTNYISLHTGGEIFPMDVLYAAASYPYETFSYWVVSEGNSLFQDLKHWGVFYDTWVGAYNNVRRMSPFSSLSGGYAAYQYRAAALTVEWWGVPKHNLHAQEFYISTLLSLLMHHDRVGDSMIYSNAFLTKTIEYAGTALAIYLNKTYMSASDVSETKIYTFNSTRSPQKVYIDGIQRLEGASWSWNPSIRTMTVTGANKLVLVEWVYTPGASKSGDFNGDESVDVYDALILTSHLNLRTKDPGWDPKIDLNYDGIIDLYDVLVFSGYYGT